MNDSRRPFRLFRYCPRCAAPVADQEPAIPFLCQQCELTYYFNPTVSAAAFIYDPDGRVLFIRRAQEPARGKLAIPGGFIDIGETAEVALAREVREEVGLLLKEVQYLGSWTNDYLYRGILYPVVDLVFEARCSRPEEARPLDGAAAIEWHRPEVVDGEELAFGSMQKGLAVVKAKRGWDKPTPAV